MIFFVAPSYTDPHEHINSYSPGWLFNLSLFLGKLFFKIHPFFNVNLNPNVYISFIIFIPIFGIQGKVIVFLSLILLLLLLILLSLSKLLNIFCNVFQSYTFCQNISVRYSITALKYFSEQIFVALARNLLNILLIVLEDIHECD